jgi:hypothetical protein
MGQEISFSSTAYNQLWDPVSPLTNRYWLLFSLGVKWYGHKADHSNPSTAKVKHGEAISPLSHMF